MARRRSKKLVTAAPRITYSKEKYESIKEKIATLKGEGKYTASEPEKEIQEREGDFILIKPNPSYQYQKKAYEDRKKEFADRKDAKAKEKTLKQLEKEKFKQSRVGVMKRKLDAATGRIASKLHHVAGKRLKKPKKIFKHEQLTVDISERNAPYIPTFMTYDIEEEKRSMFFS